LTGSEAMGVTSVSLEATEPEALKRLKRSIVCVCSLRRAVYVVVVGL
jgi:hypothetical protein